MSPTGPAIARARRLAAGAAAAALALATYAAPAAAPESAAAPARDAGIGVMIQRAGIRIADRPVRERPGWRPPRVILLAADLRDRRAELESVAPGVKFVVADAATPAAGLAAADASIGVCTAELLRRAEHLAWIQWLGAGVERCVQVSGIREHHLLLTNMQRAAGASMAEHVMGLMLVLSRHLDVYIGAQQHARWIGDSDDAPLMQDLEGKTLLVVGLGGIGTEVARRAHAFGMRVIATRASGKSGPDYVSYVGLPDELLSLAGQADYVANCAPLTPQTTGIFNQGFFAAMKPGAYFLSVGRGRSTVTADLIEALAAHRIAGAGLDVTDPEPLPAASPLWRMANVVITPHVAAYSPVADEVKRALLRENLRRYVAGEPMLSVVDVERGY
jgi:phosphoglycerate dehydrogenase-like enzyme